MSAPSVALIGGGTIARSVAEAAASGHLEGVHFVSVAGSAVPASKRVQDVAKILQVPVVDFAGTLAGRPTWVLEAAGVRAAREIVIPCLENGVNVVMMSVGALADDGLRNELRQRRVLGTKVRTPAGAIGGLDAIAALNALGDLHSVELETTKAPAGLAGAPFFAGAGARPDPDVARTVFRGTAREAIAGFPSNVNVAVALGLAGLGLDETMVEIRSDPAAAVTTHRIRARGAAGELEVTLRNLPHPSNPRTSWLAALSAIDALRRIALEQG